LKFVHKIKKIVNFLETICILNIILSFKNQELKIEIEKILVGGRLIMITIREAEARGKANFGWLESQHTFSFGSYYDPKFMGFASLRVINEDKVQAGQGFGTHGHRDMEIISYVIDGALEHKDSMGHSSILHPGEVQRISAGKGMLHSEYNYSQTDLVHFLQIWIQPETGGLLPSYEQKNFSEGEKLGKLRLIASRDGRENSVTIHQDVNLYSTLLNGDHKITYHIADHRCIWVQIVKGSILLNDRVLSSGDGAAIIEEKNIILKGDSDRAELLLFDMANNV
jgi:redox-sensitive bicupin YhaK (pirin superfamily)